MFKKMINKFQSNYARGKAQRAEFLSKVNPLSPAALVATWFGSGLLLPGPGTWGTIAGFLSLWIIISTGHYFGLGDLMIATIILILTIILFCSGLWAIKHIEKKTGRHDSSYLVIDEVVAVWLLAIIIPLPVFEVFGAFLIVCFRIFDIAKPWPINWADRRVKGAWGVMLDDILAAAYCFIVFLLLLVLLFFVTRGF